MELLNEGGLLAFVAPRGIADTPGNKFVREYLVNHADLITALRLPDTLFMQTSGIEVGSDLLIFQKHSRKATLSLREKMFLQVRGNCDWGSTLPKEELVPLGGKRIFALHGHTRLVKYGLQDLVSEAKARKADVAIYGHTHVARVDYIDGIYFMCPGSVRGGDYGMIDITDKGEIACLTASL